MPLLLPEYQQHFKWRLLIECLIPDQSNYPTATEKASFTRIPTATDPNKYWGTNDSGAYGWQDAPEGTGGGGGTAGRNPQLISFTNTTITTGGATTLYNYRAEPDYRH